MRTKLPINLKSWIEDHRELLKPPVGNKMVYEDTDFMIMIVGGPNIRKDFHVNRTEEFFFQIEGDINLKIREEGQTIDVPIKEGEIFLLPPSVPHSPQRPANTVGLVVEKKRAQGQLDGFQWYCDHCNSKVYDEFFQLENIVTQLPPLFEGFYSSPEKSTCKNCGTRVERL